LGSRARIRTPKPKGIFDQKLSGRVITIDSKI
jgi:hypothetical protein